MNYHFIIKKIIFFFLIFFYGCHLLMGCGSPRNHQVKLQENHLEFYSKVRTFESYKYSLKSVWAEGPYTNVAQTSSLLIFIYNDMGQLMDLPDGLTLGFWATMPSMGHGLEDAGYFEHLGRGIYENSNIVFQMSGDWKIDISILDENYNELDKVSWREFF